MNRLSNLKSLPIVPRKNVKSYLKMPSKIIVEDKRDKTIFPSIGHVADCYGLTRKHVARKLQQRKNLKVGCRTAKISRKTSHARNIVLGGVPFGSLYVLHDTEDLFLLSKSLIKLFLS